jgi:multiple sugar transport system ATP-binding protein
VDREGLDERGGEGVSALRFERVSKSYKRGAAVLRDIDLDIADGSFVTLVGPSGCGKSTMLNLVAGFERPSAGHILVDGQVIDKKPPRERGVAMVFQSYALYPHLDVRHNIAFPLEVAGLPKEEIDRRVKETASRLEIERLLDRRPKELSGGQRQRVALGRALVRRTRLCLFDEPLSNLDAALRGHMRVEIKKLHEETGATFVYVTHDQAEAMTMSDEVVVLNAGVVQQVGSPRTIYREPANTFVATFMGVPSINLVRPAVLKVPDLAARRDIVVGVRPEDLTVGAGQRPENAISGRVYVTEPMGAETWVTVEVSGERVVGRAPGDFHVRSGELVWLAYDRARVLLFDARTRRRVER